LLVACQVFTVGILPQAFLVENIKNLDSGKKVGPTERMVMESAFNKCGYETDFGIHDSIDSQCAQARTRLYGMGVLHPLAVEFAQPCSIPDWADKLHTYFRTVKGRSPTPLALERFLDPDAGDEVGAYTPHVSPYTPRPR
jgi:site-specific DNA-cytosine methylase